MSLIPQVASCAVVSGFNYQQLLALEPQDLYNVHFSLVPSRYEHKNVLKISLYGYGLPLLRPDSCFYSMTG